MICQAAASWEGLFLVPWDYFARPSLSNRAAGQRLLRREQQRWRCAGSSVKCSRLCQAGKSSPATNCCLLPYSCRNHFFFSPQGAASLLDVGRRPTGRTSFHRRGGAEGYAAYLAFAASLAQDSSPGETSGPDNFCLRKVPLALRKVKAANCLPGWE